MKIQKKKVKKNQGKIQKKTHKLVKVKMNQLKKINKKMKVNQIMNRLFKIFTLITTILLFLVVPVFSVTSEENTDSDTSTIYGGQSSIIYEYDLYDSCQMATVNITSELEIHSTPDGIREYYLKDCTLNETAYIGNDYNDLWHCNCTNGEFNLEISTLINTINKYNFTIKFYVEEEEQYETQETTTFTRTGGGGGGFTTPLPEEEECVPEWECTSWSGCIDGTRTRECTDLNQCDIDEDKPSETQSCQIIQFDEDDEPVETDITTDQELETQQDDENFTAQQEEQASTITGALVGVGEDGAVWTIFLLLIAAMILYITLKKKNE